ncbi:hypothetical protein [Parvibaculum sp.]|uniref:hypothetical protein n=1 Tax=Parvibaculum sp. TaxID=2024848 RepID=UPI002FD92F4A
MGKLLGGFILGFLACVWTYGLDPTQAVFGFSHKLAATHDQLQEEYRVDPRYGHKGQYKNHNRKTGAEAMPMARPSASLASPAASWLSQMGGPPVM